MTDHASPVVRTTHYILDRTVDFACWDCGADVLDEDEIIDNSSHYEVMQQDTDRTALVRLLRDDDMTCFHCDSARIAMWVKVTTREMSR